MSLRWDFLGAQMCLWWHEQILCRKIKFLYSWVCLWDPVMAEVTVLLKSRGIIKKKPTVQDVIFSFSCPSFHRKQMQDQLATWHQFAWLVLRESIVHKMLGVQLHHRCVELNLLWHQFNGNTRKIQKTSVCVASLYVWWHAKLLIKHRLVQMTHWCWLLGKSTVIQ